MAKISDWLQVRKHGTGITRTISVKTGRVQVLADALEGLKGLYLTASVSELFSEAVIEKWERERPQEANDG